jgi:microcystin degradation protein MlrC
MPLDAVYLDMHGAMVVKGLDDAEADWFAATRDVVGAACLIGVSFDLHANLTALACEIIDLASAFRTAPHVDELETRQKTVAMLVDGVGLGRRPAISHVRVPLRLSGEQSSTVVEPAASLYATLPEVDAQAEILDASLFMGYPWAEGDRVGASVAVTAFDDAIGRDAATKIADALWRVRDDFGFGVPFGSMNWCIETALASSEPCVFISDSGDNPTAGAPGDVPLALRCLLAQRVKSAVVASIADPLAVSMAFAAGIGRRITVDLGGKLDAVTEPPLRVEAIVRYLQPNDTMGGDIAVLFVQGISVIVTSRRRPFHFIAHMQELGVDPLAHKIVVVKIGYLEPDLAAHAPLALLALTPGCVDQRHMHGSEPDLASGGTL